ncbi:MAG: hypothetical protein V3T42_02940, partial [Nitrospirales bacterium]
RRRLCPADVAVYDQGSLARAKTPNVNILRTEIPSGQAVAMSNQTPRVKLAAALCWTDFFEHSRQLLIPVLPQAFMCDLRVIFNTP